jgi:hypothetical protein
MMVDRQAAIGRSNQRLWSLQQHRCTAARCRFAYCMVPLAQIKIWEYCAKFAFMRGEHSLLMQRGKQAFRLIGKAGEAISIDHQRQTARQQAANQMPRISINARCRADGKCAHPIINHRQQRINRAQHDRGNTGCMLGQSALIPHQRHQPCAYTQGSLRRKPRSAGAQCRAAKQQRMPARIFMRILRGRAEHRALYAAISGDFAGEGHAGNMRLLPVLHHGFLLAGRT